MVWKPQTYASKKKLKTISLGSLRMRGRQYDSDEADDEASEDCRPCVFAEKKCKSLHEELKPKRVQFDLPLSIKKNATKVFASGPETLEDSDPDQPSVSRRDSPKKRCESPPPSRGRVKECNYAPEFRRDRPIDLSLGGGSRSPQVRIVTNSSPEKRVQFDLRSFPRYGKALKRANDLWRDEDKEDWVSSAESEPQCPLSCTISRPDRTKSGRESKKYLDDFSDDPKEIVETIKKEILPCSSFIFGDDGKFQPKEYVTGGWCIRLDPDTGGLKCSESVIGNTSYESDDSLEEETLPHLIGLSPRAQSANIGGDKSRRRGRSRSLKLGRDRTLLPSLENAPKDVKNRPNKNDPKTVSIWKCPLRDSSGSDEHSPNESLVQFDDPRMWKSKDGQKKEDRNLQGFQCSHKVTKKPSLTQQNDVDECKTNDDYPICTITEGGPKGNTLRSKIQFPCRRSDNRGGAGGGGGSGGGGANKARATVEISHAQMLDLYSTDTDATDATPRNQSCPLKRKVRRASEGISASMKQECVETNSQIRLKIESEIMIDIPPKSKEKYLLEGSEKKPVGILRNSKKAPSVGEDEISKTSESRHSVTERSEYTFESANSKSVLVGSTGSDQDIVFPERERRSAVPDAKEWREPESSDSPLYQTVSPCCESSTSMEAAEMKKLRLEQFKSRAMPKKEKEASSRTEPTIDVVDLMPDRKGRVNVRDLIYRKPPPPPPLPPPPLPLVLPSPPHYRKCESTDDMDSNEHRNFGARGGGSAKGETKAAKVALPVNPPVDSKFVARKRDIDKRELDYRVESTRSESSLASSSSCYQSNLNVCSHKNTEERKSYFGYGSKLLRQTVKTRYLCKHVYEQSSSNVETPDEISPALESPISKVKYKPLLRDVLRYIPRPSQQSAPTQPVEVKDKAEETDPSVPIDAERSDITLVGKDMKNKLCRERNLSQDQLLLRGVSIGSSMSWCGPRGSLAAMTKSRLYVDNLGDSHSGSSFQCVPSEIPKRRMWKVERALKESVSSGSYTSAHSKVSSSPEVAVESCSCPRMYGCDRRTINAASQTNVTVMDVQGAGSIMDFLGTAWELKKQLDEATKKK